MRRYVLLMLLAVASASCADRAAEHAESPISVEAATVPDGGAPGTLALPNRPGTIKFAVIGDSGTATKGQYEVGRQMALFHSRFAFDFVLMAGDNIYDGRVGPEEYVRRFEKPYAELLQAGVRFYAALGNHDDPRQSSYAPFNMHGERYYTFEKRETGLRTLLLRSAQFFALDTTNLDREQLAWLTRELAASRADWKICFFHHPLYSSGRYGWSWGRRRLLEPLLIGHGVQVVFSGHEHVYERLKLQAGVQYFTSGGAGWVREGDLSPGDLTARGYDADLHFMLIEISGDALYFQAINRTGETVDAGVVRQVENSRSRGPSGPQEED